MSLLFAVVLAIVPAVCFFCCLLFTIDLDFVLPPSPKCPLSSLGIVFDTRVRRVLYACLGLMLPIEGWVSFSIPKFMRKPSFLVMHYSFFLLGIVFDTRVG